MIKRPVQKLTQGTTQKPLQHHDATAIFLDFPIFIFFFIDNFLSEFSKK